MTETAPTAAPAVTPTATERVRISCPGCGRHDFVDWPSDRETFHWKCFNCSKEFDLHRHARH